MLLSESERGCQASRRRSVGLPGTPASSAAASCVWALFRQLCLVCMLLICPYLAAPALSQAAEPRSPSTRLRFWSGTGFERAHTRMLQPEEIYGRRPPDHARHLSFTVVYLEGTKWNTARVLRHVRKTARILEPCGIGLSGIRLVKARTPRELRNIDVTVKVPGSDIPRDVYELAKSLPKGIEWPVLFFVGRIDGEGVLARSYQQGDVLAADLKGYPYMNTAWVSYRAHWVERPEVEYSALAHEVAHLLCRCGHEQGPQRHLLHEYRNFLGARVLPQHCERFNDSNLVTSLPRLGLE